MNVEYMCASQFIGGIDTLAPEIRVPFGWQVLGLAPDGAAIEVRWSGMSQGLGRLPSRFRLTSAIDSRECKRVEVRILGNGTLVSAFDLRFTPALQTVEIPLSPDIAEAFMQLGCTLRLIEGTGPWWFLTKGSSDTPLPHVLQPHALIGPASNDRMAQFLHQMLTLATVQPFGWMEGCILDGLWDLHQVQPQSGYLQAMAAHLHLFFPENGRLVYEDPRSRPHDDRVDGIESTLMFAALQRWQPMHPWLEGVRQFWDQRLKLYGRVQDSGTLSAEGAYTVAYPMALLARTRHDIAGLHGAWRELRTRRDHLVNPYGIHLRWHMQGHHSFTNWCRGIAWYLLGFSRSFDAVGVELAPADLRDEFVRAAEWIRGYQNEAGLWHAFVDDPRCGPDTAGSAGIAAAMAQGVKLGLLPVAYRDSSNRAVNSLMKYLTPDGLLGGITQSNRGGEALQRSDYRVISPMGMGMLAQAVAHLMSLQSTA